MIAESLTPEGLSNFRATSKYFYDGLKSRKPYIIHKNLVQHFMENPKKLWNADFLQKVSLSSISKAINVLSKNLEISRLNWNARILQGKSLEETLALNDTLPENWKITERLHGGAWALQGKSFEELLAFNDKLPEHISCMEL